MYWRSREHRRQRPRRRGAIHLEFAVILPVLLTIPLSWIAFEHSADVPWWLLSAFVWGLAAIYPLWRVCRS